MSKIKLDRDRVIRVSFSSIANYMDCRRKFWFSNIKGYELIAFKPYNVTGNCVHYGLHQLYSKNKNAVKDAMAMFNNEIKKLRKDNLSLSEKDENEIIYQKLAINGMLEAYKNKYSNHIKKTKHISNELKLELNLDKRTVLVIKMDNIVDIEKRGKHVHEIKTVKTLTPDYVRNIKNDLQTGIYFHGHNRTVSKKDRLKGIMYDVIRKPSIRQTKKETASMFLDRVAEYYTSPNESELFYMDFIEYPLLTEDRVFNTVESVVDDMRRCLVEDDFYPNDRHCYVKSRCQFYDICHTGENKLTLANYKVRQKPDKSEETNACQKPKKKR